MGSPGYLVLSVVCNSKLLGKMLGKVACRFYFIKSPRQERLDGYCLVLALCPLRLQLPLLLF